MVVVLDCGDLPRRQFETRGWQRQKKRFLFLKRGCTAAFFLLEGLVVELKQLLRNRFVQLSDGKEPLVAQGGNDPGGHHAHGALDEGFVLWFHPSCF